RAGPAPQPVPVKTLFEFPFFNLLRAVVVVMASSCATVPGAQVGDQVAPIVPAYELSDAELLNVSVQVFDPGQLPEDPDKKNGLSAEIREAESRFAPIHLKHTLQRTGYWGVVRVVPDNDIGSEVLVQGKIEHSDGENAVLHIMVSDARNVVWFQHTYAETARPEEHNSVEPEKQDVFQDLFNSIANDIAIYRNSLSPSEIAEIRQVAALKYAYSMAPDAFASYLTETPEGRVAIQRLPAENDPMFDRVEAVKVRDDLLVDTINDYYDIYYQDLWEPYSSWRRYRHEEVATLRKLEREALTKQLLGITAIVGAIALGASGDYETAVRTRPLQDILIAGGAYSVYSGYQTRQESKINKDAIEELGASFSSEAEPLTIEVEGKTIRLTGSAEQQYAKWRSMLKQIYAQETGLIPQSDSVPGFQSPASLETEP
ncbi:MAG: hypothetical protein KJO32_18880, partial [Deltaproteobacteria bacterium]|nr:hypothetical protein [Deltaproteobacteria bacterium]